MSPSHTSPPSYPLALAEAVFVNLIWATSFLFAKIALQDLGPLTIGGLRYFLGFLILLPFLLRSGQPFKLTPALWARLALIGLFAYTIGNGAMFWSLRYLSATMVSFLNGVIPLLVLLGGIFYLKEIPNRLQALGILLSLAGLALFFSAGLQPGEPLGLAILAIGLVSFTLFGLLGRSIARGQSMPTLVLTAWPLAIGGGLMLLLGLLIEGIPHAGLPTLALILWLAAVNTALAYALYNHSLQVLTAFEMNIFLYISPLFTALLAWFLLGETLTAWQIGGMLIVLLGIALTQRR
jgi:drug/metabolite transporter (DMT)-like permease